MRMLLLITALLLASCADEPPPTVPVAPDPPAPPPAPEPVPDEMETRLLLEILIKLPDFAPEPVFTLADDGTLTSSVNGVPCDLTLEEAEFAAVREAIASLGLDAIEDEETIAVPAGAERGLPSFAFRLHSGDRTHTRWVEGFQLVEHTDPRVAGLTALYQQLADLAVRCEG
ncbi:MAG: hypothetical protein OYK82_00570 [Gammaproteobacteria bacterium]|nr:hypothetical protein [Gammaproteobacteria bacterium]